MGDMDDFKTDLGAWAWLYFGFSLIHAGSKHGTPTAGAVRDNLQPILKNQLQYADLEHCQWDYKKKGK